MKQYRPSYYKDFRCIAGACSDNCCIGWEIDIDPQTDAFYQSVVGDFGCRLKQDILRDEHGSQFILRGERCPFLNEKNLCDIYIHLGEQALCEICTQHPRYHEWYGSIKESGVGLCCEAAGRLILSQDSLPSYEYVDIDEESSDDIDEEGFDALRAARNYAFELAKQHDWAALLSFGEELQDALEWEDWEEIRRLAAGEITLPPAPNTSVSPNSLQQLLTFLSELEPIDPQWPALLRNICNKLPEVLAALLAYKATYPRWEADMDQLIHYFLYRYFCKSLFDEDVRSKTILPLVACIVVLLLNAETFLRKGSFTLDDQIFTAKQFSKEIEYCTENLEALCEAFWNPNFLLVRQLSALLLQIFA
ncbi:MAG: hypothetical protein E7475_00735 [Ruminococcaceae bacterium]|nr:hypothetical protein [Oscillospiraceae bacterium]